MEFFGFSLLSVLITGVLHKRKQAQQHKTSSLSFPLYNDPVSEKLAFQQQNELSIHSFITTIDHIFTSIKALPLYSLLQLTSTEYCQQRYKEPVLYIATLTELQTIIPLLHQSPILAIDIEYTSQSYHGFICLIQLSTIQYDIIIDTLIPDIRKHLQSLLSPLFMNSKIIKVFHGANNDIQWLHSNFGLYILGLLDTMILGQVYETLLKESSTSIGSSSNTINYHHKGTIIPQALDRLLFYIDNYQLTTTIAPSNTFSEYQNPLQHKHHYQRADWRQRPLLLSFIQYARTDSAILLYISNFLFQNIKLLLLSSSAIQSNNVFINGIKKCHELTMLRYDILKKEKYDASNALSIVLQQISKIWEEEKELYLHTNSDTAQLLLSSSSSPNVKYSEFNQFYNSLTYITVHNKIIHTLWTFIMDMYIYVCQWRQQVALHNDIRQENIINDIYLLRICCRYIFYYYHDIFIQPIIENNHLIINVTNNEIGTQSNEYIEEIKAIILVYIEKQWLPHIAPSSTENKKQSITQRILSLSQILVHKFNLLLHYRTKGMIISDYETIVPDITELKNNFSISLDSSLSNNNNLSKQPITDPVLLREQRKNERTMSRFVPRATPLYNNIQLMAPDGTLMARIDRRKAQWYLDQKAGVIASGGDIHIDNNGQILENMILSSDDEDENETMETKTTINQEEKLLNQKRRNEPLVIRLLKQPNGLGHAGDVFHLSPRKNECVICGKRWKHNSATSMTSSTVSTPTMKGMVNTLSINENTTLSLSSADISRSMSTNSKVPDEYGLTRCFIIPHNVRQYFPLAVKSYTNHDVVLTCTRCHRQADVASSALLRKIAQEMGITLSTKLESSNNNYSDENPISAENTVNTNTIPFKYQKAELLKTIERIQRLCKAIVDTGLSLPHTRIEEILKILYHDDNNFIFPYVREYSKNTEIKVYKTNRSRMKLIPSRTIDIDSLATIWKEYQQLFPTLMNNNHTTINYEDIGQMTTVSCYDLALHIYEKLGYHQSTSTTRKMFISSYNPIKEIVRSIILGDHHWQQAAPYFQTWYPTDIASIPELTNNINSDKQENHTNNKFTNVDEYINYLRTQSLTSLLLPEFAEYRLIALVRRWRAFFIASLQPKAMPVGWHINYQVFTAGNRVRGKHEDSLMYEIENYTIQKLQEKFISQ